MVEQRERPPRCHGCATLCQRVKPRYVACKTARLCDRVDPGLAMFLYDVWDVAELEAANERLLKGAYELQSLRGKPFPSCEADLAKDLKEAHFALFRFAMPSVAGAFRKEPVMFGGSGRNRREGVLHEEIEVELEHTFAVMNRVGPGAPIEVKAAVFLARLFRVHPFLDGNGRIGRHFVERIFASEDMVVRAWSTSGKERRRYLAALEYAHRHTLDRPNEGTRYLAEWLARQASAALQDEDLL